VQSEAAPRLFHAHLLFFNGAARAFEVLTYYFESARGKTKRIIAPTP
jgi:hypothetical protein